MNPRRLALAALAALALGLAGCGPNPSRGISGPQVPDSPDRRGEVYGGDVHPSGSPRVQVTLTHSQRNTDGSAPGGWDGLCVIASCVNSLHTLGYHAEADALWARALRLPGGYGPEKLERLLKEVAPHLDWVSIVNTSTAEAERLLRAGVPVCATMSTGRTYNYMPIHHMVNPVHLDGQYAAVRDNNRPEVNSWMPRREYDRRYLDGSTGWTFAFAPKAVAGGTGLLAAIGLLIGLGFVRLREAVA